jgi:hypothetical protein
VFYLSKKKVWVILSIRLKMRERTQLTTVVDLRLFNCANGAEDRVPSFTDPCLRESAKALSAECMRARG